MVGVGIDDLKMGNKKNSSDAPLKGETVLVRVILLSVVNVMMPTLEKEKTEEKVC